MSVELLISTMNQKDVSLLEKMNICSDAVVVNQCDEENIKKIEYSHYSVLWINTRERGLSRSRNMAIKNATADICVLADDDEIFLDDYPDIIESFFDKYPKVSLGRFQVSGIESEFKKYSTRPCKIGYIGTLRMSSVEIAFRRKAVLENDILFDELLGAGSHFPMGEENAFLFNCLDKGINMRYEPIVIAQLHIGNSTWFNGFTDNYFIGRGAAFCAMSECWFIPLMLQFVIRRMKVCREQVGVIHSIQYMLQGKNQYLKMRGRK